MPTVLGVYPGNRQAQLEAFERWLGKPADLAIAFSADENWSGPGYLLGSDSNGGFIGALGRRMVWSIHLWPGRDRTAAENLALMRECANGTRDEDFRRWARDMLTHRGGDSDPIDVRICWEIGGPWYYWTAAATSEPETFKTAWNRCAAQFKSVSSRFRCNWDVVPDYGPVEQWYPGDQYVDVIAQDVYWFTQYDDRNPAVGWEKKVNGHSRGLAWIKRFANEHGKAVAIPEWGVPGGSGNDWDGAGWITLFRNWCIANDVLYCCYWDGEDSYDGKLSDNDPAGSAGALRSLFLNGIGTTQPTGPTSAAQTIGAGADTLVLRVNQDAYQGSAQYTVSVDGDRIGGTLTAVALRSANLTDTITVKGDWQPGRHAVSIDFLNDAYASPGLDRNLYLVGATFNGVEVAGASLSFQSGGPQSFVFTAEARPTKPVPRQTVAGRVKDGPGPITATLPSVLAGSVIVAAFGLYESNEDGIPSAVTANPPLAFTRHVESGDLLTNQDGVRASIWTARAPASGTYTVSAAVAGYSAGNAFFIEVDGVDAGVAVEAFSSASGSGATASTGAASGMTRPNGMAVACLVLDGISPPVTIGTPSGWTRAGVNLDPALGMIHAVDYRTLPATEPVSAAWPISASALWGGAIIVLRPAAAASEPPPPDPQPSGTRAPFLLSTTGRILVGEGAGRPPLLAGAAAVAAPVVGTPAAELEFQAAKRLPDVPRVNDQFERFGIDRDWASNYNHPTDGFAGIRWQPTWKRADGYYGSWEMAEGEVYSIRRKGPAGADARTVVFECGPNPAKVPPGDKVVVWEVPGWDGGVAQTATFDLAGYRLPLRQELTVVGGSGSTTYDPNGRRIVEVDAGVELPDFNHTVGDFDAGWWRPKLMRLRHWSFYADRATRALRHPLGWFKYNSKELVLPNGGDINLGGIQHIPTWYDWTRDWNNFGASLVEKLWKDECEGLAYEFGDTDPRRLAVELENEPTAAWRGNATDGAGYGDLLPDVWYAMARAAWGKQRTLIVKPTSFGNIDSLISEWDWTCPTGDLAHLVVHNYDGQAHLNGKAGGDTLNWGDIGQTDWYAQTVAGKVRQFGFPGGGITEHGAYTFEWWDFNAKVGDEERGRRYGRMLTSMARRGLHYWAWGNTGDGINCADVYSIDGKRIEGYWRSMAPYCRRAGLTTT